MDVHCTCEACNRHCDWGRGIWLAQPSGWVSSVIKRVEFVFKWKLVIDLQTLVSLANAEEKNFMSCLIGLLLTCSSPFIFTTSFFRKGSNTPFCLLLLLKVLLS